MRVKRGVTKHARHNKIRKATKGMSHANRASVRRGKQAVTKSLQFMLPATARTASGPSANCGTPASMLPPA